jgi:type IX secretion system PorP/SprF family membrane protein
MGVMFAAVINSYEAQAQLNPLAGIYFQNQYLGNPAMAGAEKGLVVNTGFRKQWSAIPGAPQTQAVTAEYGTSKKVSLGLNFNNDEAGLIKRTRVMGTYAYRLPFSDENQTLSFGISFGFMDDRVMNENINGDQNDASVSKFNQRETYIDGDFGIAYTSSRLTVQLAAPNLKSLIKKDDMQMVSDQSTFFSAISYRFEFPNAVDGLGLEPKIAFRGVRGFDNIWDFGANITVANNAASVMAVYHSSESATIGLGANVKSLGAIIANYTTSTAALRGYTSGDFQLGLRLGLNAWKKKE